MLKNDFIVKINKSSLILKADPDTLRDIASVLDHLVNMVHLLKNKSIIEYNKQQRINLSHQYQINQQNHDRAIEIFKRFLTHLNNNCAGNKTKALHEIKSEYHLKSIEAEIYIAEGKKILKEEQIKKQLKLF